MASPRNNLSTSLILLILCFSCCSARKVLLDEVRVEDYALRRQLANTDNLKPNDGNEKDNLSSNRVHHHRSRFPHVPVRPNHRHSFPPLIKPRGSNFPPIIESGCPNCGSNFPPILEPKCPNCGSNSPPSQETDCPNCESDSPGQGVDTPIIDDPAPAVMNPTPVTPNQPPPAPQCGPSYPTTCEDYPISVPNPVCDCEPGDDNCWDQPYCVTPPVVECDPCDPCCLEAPGGGLQGEAQVSKVLSVLQPSHKRENSEPLSSIQLRHDEQRNDNVKQERPLQKAKKMPTGPQFHEASPSERKQKGTKLDDPSPSDDLDKETEKIADGPSAAIYLEE